MSTNLSISQRKQNNNTKHMSTKNKTNTKRQMKAPEAIRDCVVTAHVAGFQFHSGQLVNPKAGDELLLISEPANLHDANAIRIDHASTKLTIGYVKRDDAASLRSLKESGWTDFQAVVVSYHPANPSWQACVYRVYATAPVFTVPQEERF